MKILTQFGILISVALSMCNGGAQTTNILLRANVVLKGTAQTPSGVKGVRLVNKDILAALNATGEFNFTSKATILLVSGEVQPAIIMIREEIGPQSTDTDVSAYFSVLEVGDGVHTVNEKTRWETWSFAFNNGITNETGFQLWGSTTIHRGGIHSSSVGTIEGPQRIESKVRGVGRLQGEVTIYSGTISCTKATVESEAAEL